MTKCRAALAAAALVALAGVTAACSEPTACELAFQAAADVPASEDNNPELIETLKVCPSSEWGDVLDRYPGVLGGDSITTEDEILIWRVLCPDIALGESEFCDDAREAGLFE